MSLEELVAKKLSPNEARARSFLAKTTLDALRVEISAARTGLSNYPPVDLLAEPTEK